MSAPPGYSSETILEIPKTRRPILPIQGGGALCAPAIQYTGIALATNSCYMNAGIQLLYSIDALRDYFKSVTPTEIDAYKAGGADCTDEKLKIFKNVLKTLKTLFESLAKGSSIDDTTLKGYYDVLVTVNNGSSSSKDYLQPLQQEDSQEFVSAVLGIFTCIDGLKVKDSFTLSEVSTIVCKDNTIPLVLKEADSKILSLALPSAATSIQKCIEANGKPETFTAGNNQLEACAVIGSKTGEAISKQLSVHVRPSTQNVLIQLKRYGFSTASAKLDSPVYLNRKILLQESDGTSSKAAYFELKGVVLHHGSTVNSGHYTYLVVQEGRVCSVINDSRVLPQDIQDTTSYLKVNEETLKNAYLFLYTRSTPDAFFDDVFVTDFAQYPMDAQYTVNGSAIDLKEATEKTEKPKGVAKPQEKFPLIMLEGGFYVRNPTAEGVKEKIRELDFTNGEKGLFNSLNFNKPYIKKYITLNNSNKDKFFNFWKTFIELDGTMGIIVRTKKEAAVLDDYPKELLAVYLEYLSNKAMDLMEYQEIGEEDYFIGGIKLKERSEAIKDIMDKHKSNLQLIKEIKELYDKINKNLNPIPNYKSILENCKIIIENSKSIYKNSQKTDVHGNTREKILDKINELTRSIQGNEDLTETPKISEVSLRAYNVARALVDMLGDLEDKVKHDIIIGSSETVSTKGGQGYGEEGSGGRHGYGGGSDEEEGEYEGEDEVEDEEIDDDEPEDDENNIRKKGKRNSPIPTCKTRKGRQTTMHTGKEFFESNPDNYEPYYIINTIKKIMTQRYGSTKKETSDKLEILLEFLLLKFPVGDNGDKQFIKAMQCSKKKKCYNINCKKQISEETFLREVKRETPLALAFNAVINNLILTKIGIKSMMATRYNLLKDRIISSDEKDDILKLIKTDEPVK